MDKRLIILLSQKELKEEIKDLLFRYGYSTSRDEIKLTDRAKAILTKKHELSESLYKAVAKIFKDAEGTVNTQNTVTQFYDRMVKANDGVAPSEYDIIEACKLWVSKSSFPGELKYFFFKDKSSRCLDFMNTLSLNKTNKQFAERI